MGIKDCSSCDCCMLNFIRVGRWHILITRSLQTRYCCDYNNNFQLGFGRTGKYVYFRMAANRQDVMCDRFHQGRGLRGLTKEVLWGLAQHHTDALRQERQLQLHQVRHPSSQFLASHALCRRRGIPMARGHLRLNHLVCVVLVLWPGEWTG